MRRSVLDKPLYRLVSSENVAVVTMVYAPYDEKESMPIRYMISRVSVFNNLTAAFMAINAYLKKNKHRFDEIPEPITVSIHNPETVRGEMSATVMLDEDKLDMKALYTVLKTNIEEFIEMADGNTNGIGQSNELDFLFDPDSLHIDITMASKEQDKRFTISLVTKKINADLDSI